MYLTGFDPFHETQKGLADLLESEAAEAQQQAKVRLPVSIITPSDLTSVLRSPHQARTGGLTYRLLPPLEPSFLLPASTTRPPPTISSLTTTSAATSLTEGSEGRVASTLPAAAPRWTRCSDWREVGLEELLGSEVSRPARTSSSGWAAPSPGRGLAWEVWGWGRGMSGLTSRTTSPARTGRTG